MQKIVRGIIKVVLTIIFFVGINNIVNFLVDIFLPSSQEVPGVILIYLLIFVLEWILAYACTNLIFKKIGKKDY
ncbi:hypothetical protein [Marinilactibacillus psychrotolerans]|uniref:hypothetical protein n=1 Tax=Marinilactibacillus psychrotolerans TaxID=191770 RepID=UPI000B35ABF0|nr:hypothetical protein [Marinilactibacillus psychrotolerans]